LAVVEGALLLGIWKKKNKEKKWMENRVDAMRVFGSLVVVAFQIAFRAEIHANDVFLFFKNHF